MKTTSLRSIPLPSRPLSLLLATLTVALAAGFAQSASAQPMGDHGPGGRDGAHAVGRMLDSVNATPEQRAQIKQIMKAAQTDLKAQRESGKALHTQMDALFAQPTVDARAAETLRQQMSAQRDQASKRMLQARLDASGVLTAEQRKLMADSKTQRSAMRERHRAERQRLDTPSR